MNVNARDIPGYTYGASAVSSATLDDLQRLKISAGFTADDQHYLRMAGAVLEDQVERIVNHWRANIIAGIPHLARHSRSPDGTPLPDYLARSNRRFQQWILDTCRRPYDQDWLNYQQEIALRHTSVKKKSDGQRRFYAACSLQRHPCFRGGPQRHDQTVPGSQGTYRF